MVKNNVAGGKPHDTQSIDPDGLFPTLARYNRKFFLCSRPMHLKSILTHLPAPLRKIVTPELIKFVLVGGFSAILEFSLLILLVEKVHIEYLISNIVAFAITNIFTYILTKLYVFNSSNNSRTYETLLFTLCLLGGLLVNQVVLWALVEFTPLDYRIAKVVAILVTVVWNFFTRKHLVFKDRTVAR